MKKIYIFLSFTLISAVALAQNNPGFYQFRLVSPGGEPNTFRIQVRAISTDIPTTGSFCSDAGFRIHWNTAAITSINMDQPTSYGASLNEQAAVAGAGNNKTQAVGFCASCNFFLNPINWVQNQWVNLGTMFINGTGSAADFDILPFDGQFPNFGNDFTDYTPAINIALPLNLISFRTEKSGTKDALISWVTTNEENTSHFIVERSFDKKSWTKVGSVTAAGYSLGIQQYSYTDIGVYNGRDNKLTAFYRLQMVDLDSKFKTSPIESVIFGNSGTTGREFVVYPNPSSDGIQIEWDANLIDQPTSLEFFDVEGKLVYSQKVSENTNQEYIDFGHTNIMPGLYLLRILNGQEPLDFKQIVVGQR
ncbi:MAG: T9SS type A sorting domain-containing protein [Saprospiraceae bacterium]|uniref:T9SS type A sorting domain-containing protein n=1 Tax=Candidatus Opimibacter skivensis TaxID=2982028 RepID=A0A9D7SWN8_9BACT|nr:T9SS type A sorting domain-containing protein [Candidatus Opimibacter skivensis]